MDKIPMTAEGYSALESELKHCQQVERPRIIQQIPTPAPMAIFRKTPSITRQKNRSRSTRAASRNSKISLRAPK